MCQLSQSCLQTHHCSSLSALAAAAYQGYRHSRSHQVLPQGWAAAAVAPLQQAGRVAALAACQGAVLMLLAPLAALQDVAVAAAGRLRAASGPESCLCGWGAACGPPACFASLAGAEGCTATAAQQKHRSTPAHTHQVSHPDTGFVGSPVTAHTTTASSLQSFQLL